MQKETVAMFKTISKYLTIFGGTMLASGLGLGWATGYLERKDLRMISEEKRLEDERIKKLDILEKKKLAEEAAAEREHIMAEKLSAMNQEEFEKFHAEAIAKANMETIEKANQIKREAEASMIKAQISAAEQINDIRTDCLKKIEAAEKRAAEAEEKYAAIDKLFSNKNDILRAKKELDEYREQKQASEDAAKALAAKLSSI